MADAANFALLRLPNPLSCLLFPCFYHGRDKGRIRNLRCGAGKQLNLRGGKSERSGADRRPPPLE